MPRLRPYRVLLSALMAAMRLIRRLRSYIDGIDLVFGLLPGVTGYAAFVSWLDLAVRAIRGEQVAENWRTTSATAAHIGARALVSATHVRQSVVLRESVAEMRASVTEVHESLTEMRKLLREAAADAEARDRRAAERADQLYRVTVKMAWVAGFTLAAAIGSVVVAFVR